MSQPAQAEPAPAENPRAQAVLFPAADTRARVRVDGKFFRLGEQKFYVKGATYGPFAPGPEGNHYASREQTARDFAHLRELGANVARVYYVPPGWVLDLAQEHGLRLL